MEPIPRYRAAHLLPYLEFLRKVGAPVERGLRQARLPTMVDERPDVYLPQLPTLAFLMAMSKGEGIDDLGLRALQRLKMNDFSAGFVAAARRSPALRSTLESFLTHAHLEDPHFHLRILPGETTVKLFSLYRYPLDPQAQRYQDWSSIMTLVAIVRSFAGRTWCPEEIAFSSKVPLGELPSERFPNARLLTGQKAVWITVPRGLLSLPAREIPVAGAEPRAADSEQKGNAERPLDLPSSLRQVLAAYLPDGYPPIELAAEIVGTSVRTLQRRLRQSEVKYSDLVQQARFEAAAKLLRDTDARTLDIAYELAYEDPSHFARAFRRIAGVSPREYRHQHRLQ